MTTQAELTALEASLALLTDRVAHEFRTVYAKTGDLPDLATASKLNLVAAVNEIDAKLTSQGTVTLFDGGNF